MLAQPWRKALWLGRLPAAPLACIPPGQSRSETVSASEEDKVPPEPPRTPPHPEGSRGLAGRNLGDGGLCDSNLNPNPSPSESLVSRPLLLEPWSSVITVRQGLFPSAGHWQTAAIGSFLFPNKLPLQTARPQATAGAGRQPHPPLGCSILSWPLVPGGLGCGPPHLSSTSPLRMRPNRRAALTCGAGR